MLKQLNYILNRRQKLHLVLLLLAFLVGSVFELIGVSAILPLVNVVMDPAVLEEGLYALLCRILQAGDVRDFIVRYCIFLIGYYIFKNLYLLFMYNIQFRYTFHNKAQISNDLMAVYMEQDYLELINRNVAELSRNLSMDVDLCVCARSRDPVRGLHRPGAGGVSADPVPGGDNLADDHHGHLGADLHQVLPASAGCLRRAVPHHGRRAEKVAAANLQRHQGDQGQ